MLNSVPVKKAIPAGFQKMAAELSARPPPDSPIAPNLESGASNKNGTAASPPDCAFVARGTKRIIANPKITNRRTFFI